MANPAAQSLRFSSAAQGKTLAPSRRFSRTFSALLAPCRQLRAPSNHPTERWPRWPGLSESLIRDRRALQLESKQILLVLLVGKEVLQPLSLQSNPTAARDPFLELFIAQILSSPPLTTTSNAISLIYYPHHSSLEPPDCSLTRPSSPPGLCTCLEYSSPWSSLLFRSPVKGHHRYSS